MSFNLATMLTESALSHPSKTAVISGAHRLSYAELDAVSDRFAVGLQAQGIRPGDAVGLQLPNLPQFVIAYFGLLKGGAIAVPMNVLYKADEVGFILQRGRGSSPERIVEGSVAGGLFVRRTLRVDRST